MICFNFYFDKQSVEDILREIVTASSGADTHIYYVLYTTHCVLCRWCGWTPSTQCPPPSPSTQPPCRTGTPSPSPAPASTRWARDTITDFYFYFYWVLPFHIPFECIVLGPGEYLAQALVYYLPCDQSSNSGRVKRLNPGSRTSPLRRSQHK